MFVTIFCTSQRARNSHPTTLPGQPNNEVIGTTSWKPEEATAMLDTELQFRPGFTGRAGFVLNFSKCFGPISGLHTKHLWHSEWRFFYLVTYICYGHRGYFCKWCDCGFSAANSICKHSCVLLFVARIGLTLFLKGESSEEISTRWSCVQKINHLRDSCLVLINDGLKPAFRAYGDIQDSLFYAYSAIVDSFFFFLRNITFRSISLANKLSLFKPCLSQCFGQGVCYFGCDKTCTCSYTRTLRFLVPAVAHILTHSVNSAFRPKSCFKNKFRTRAGFGFQNEASLQIWPDSQAWHKLW